MQQYAFKRPSAFFVELKILTIKLTCFPNYTFTRFLFVRIYVPHADVFLPVYSPKWVREKERDKRGSESADPALC